MRLHDVTTETQRARRGKEFGVRLDLLTFDYEEARKNRSSRRVRREMQEWVSPQKTRRIQRLRGFLSVGEVPTDKKAQPCHEAGGGWAKAIYCIKVEFAIY